jgi:hypothetical protein
MQPIRCTLLFTALCTSTHSAGRCSMDFEQIFSFGPLSSKSHQLNFQHTSDRSAAEILPQSYTQRINIGIPTQGGKQYHSEPENSLIITHQLFQSCLVFVVPQYGSYLASFWHKDSCGWSQSCRRVVDISYTQWNEIWKFLISAMKKTLPKTVIHTSALSSGIDHASPGRSNTAY